MKNFKKYKGNKSACLFYLILGLIAAEVSGQTMFDLTVANPVTIPTGSTFEWHSAIPIGSGNIVADPTAAPSGLYYGVYNLGAACYSAPVGYKVVEAVCPANYVDLGASVDRLTMPAGMQVSYHTAEPVSATNRFTDDPARAPQGTYYVAYYDVANNCYSESVRVEAVIPACDADGDGIHQYVDVDEDNDGILDIDEASASFYTQSEAMTLLNSSTQLTLTSGTLTAIVDGDIATVMTFSAGSWMDKELLNLAYIAPFVLDSLNIAVGATALSADAGSMFVLQGSNNGYDWINLSDPMASTSTNTIVSVENTLDPSGAYQWYRLYGISGTTAGGEIQEITLKAAAYTPVYNGVVVDTDADGTVNTLDLDSDGDGCNDAFESIVPGYISGSDLTTYHLNVTDANADGIDDAYYTAGAYTYTNAYTNALDASINVCAMDADHDGYLSSVDLDDDNDGILDTDELIVGAGFPSHVPSTISSNMTFNGGALSALIDGDENSGIYFNASTSIANQQVWSFAYTAPVILTKIFLGTTNQNVFDTGSAYVIQFSDNGTDWQNATDTLTTTAILTPNPYSSTSYLNTFDLGANTTAHSYYRVYGISGSTNSAGGVWMTEAHFEGALNPDLDGDGLANQMDLDSDGDGCSDSFEANVVASANATSVTDFHANATDANSDGVDDVYYTSGGYQYMSTYVNYALDATINLCTMSDQDGDGKLDILDLDDDNDGVLDDDEMTCSDQNTQPTTFQTQANLDSETITSEPTAIDGLETNAYYYIGSGNIAGKKLATLTYSTAVILKRLDFTMPKVYQKVPFTTGSKLMVEGSKDGGSTWLLVSDTLVMATTPNNSIYDTTADMFSLEFIGNEVAYTQYRVVGIEGFSRSATGTWIYEVHDVSCTDRDTDSDGIADRLDLDSDGDGCNDSYESGVLGYSSGADITNYHTNGADVDNNGIDDAYYVKEYKYTSRYSTYAVNDAINFCVDIDNDGISDVVDLDDDNDGIADLSENPLEMFALPVMEGYNGGVSNLDKFRVRRWVYDFGRNQYAQSEIADHGNFWPVTQELPFDSLDLARSYAPYSSESYTTEQDQNYLGAGSLYALEYSFWVGPGTYAFNGQVDDGVTVAYSKYGTQSTMIALASVPFPASTSWVADTLVVPEGEHYWVQFRQTDTNGILNQPGQFAEVIQNGISLATPTLTPSMLPVSDFDNDGIPNHLDLDSDTDGCNDSFESGVLGYTSGSDLTTYHVNTADVNADGIDDAYVPSEYADGYATNALSTSTNVCTNPDTDGDGFPNLVDTDDDNDGILDADEDIFVPCNYTPDYQFVNYVKRSNGYDIDASIKDASNVVVADIAVTQSIGSYSSRVDPPLSTFSSTAFGIRNGSANATVAGLYGGTNNVIIGGYSIPVTSGNLTTAVITNKTTAVLTLSLTYANALGAYGVNHTNTQTVTYSNANYAYLTDYQVDNTPTTPTTSITTLQEPLISIGSGSSFDVLKDISTANNYTTAQVYYGITFELQIPVGESSTIVLDCLGTGSGESWGFVLGGLNCSDQVIAMDADNDGIKNSLDLDSDGDGCNDSFESKVPGVVDGAEVTTYHVNTTDADNNGIDDTYYTAGAYTYAGTYTNYALNAAANYCVGIDTDGDGVTDVADLDDDNDGILDTVECMQVMNSAQFDVTTNPTTITQAGVDITLGWASPLINNGYNVAAGAEPMYLFSGDTGTTYRAITYTFSQPVSELSFKVFDFDTNEFMLLSYLDTNGVSKMPTDVNVDIDANGTPTATYNATTGALNPATMFSSTFNAGTNQEVDIKIAEPITQLTIAFKEDVTGQRNLGLSMIYFVGSSCDNDGDGLDNTLDLDSDNDGCYDAIEGSASFDNLVIDSEGRLTGGVDANGVPILTGAIGQTAGTFQDATQKDANCNTVVSHEDILQLSQGVASGGQVLTNDVDPEGDVMTIKSIGVYDALGVLQTVAVDGMPVDVYDTLGVLAGSLVMQLDGSYVFTPSASYVGELSIPVTIKDTTGATSTSALSIEVIAKVDSQANNAPVAINDTSTVESGSTLIAEVLSNDSDMDGNVLTLSAALAQDSAGNWVSLGTSLQPVYDGQGILAGEAMLNASGKIEFVANGSYVGELPIMYTLSDGTLTDSGMLSLVVLAADAVNNAVYANDDAKAGEVGSNLVGNVLTNDTDPEGDVLMVSGVKSSAGTALIVDGITMNLLPSGGSIVFYPMGGYSYMPAEGYIGTEVLVITVCDNATPSVCKDSSLDLTTVVSSSTVVSHEDILQLSQGVASGGQVLTNDVDPEGDVMTIKSIGVYDALGVLQTVAVDGMPVDVYDTLGVLAGSLVMQLDGSYVFTPSASYVGELSIPVTIKDTTGATSTSALSIEVIAKVDSQANNAPVAINDTSTVESGSTLIAEVLSNDSDMDGNVLTLSAALAQDSAGNWVSLGTSLQPVYDGQGILAGEAMLNASGKIEFVANGSYVGELPIMYTLSDGTLTDSGMLSLVVLAADAVNNAVYANDDAKAGEVGSNLVGNVLTNDTDPEGDVLMVSGVKSSAGTALIVDGITMNLLPSGGSIVFYPMGGYSYMPAEGYIGTEVLVITVCDNATPSVCKDSSLDLTTVVSSSTVVSHEDILQLSQGVASGGQVLTNDVDPEGDVMTIKSIGVYDALGVLQTVAVDGMPVDVYDTLGVLAGSLVMQLDGSYVFTPSASYVGELSIPVTIKDTTGATSTSALSIEVIAKVDSQANNAPVAINDTSTVESGSTLIAEVLSNDSDMDGNVLTLSAALAQDSAGNWVSLGTSLQPVYDGQGILAGEAMLNASGKIEFVANGSYVGELPIMYTLSDGTLTDSGMLSLVVLAADAVNNAVYANDDAKAGEVGSNLVGNVLTNDTDPEGDVLMVSGVKSSAGTALIVDGITMNLLPSGGSIVFYPMGGYSYMPAEGYIGTEVLVITVCDNATPSVCKDSSLDLTTVAVSPIGICVNPPQMTGTPETTKIGISTTEEHVVTNWPDDVKNGFLVLEAQTKGMVITRMANPEVAIDQPVEGMLVWDTDDACLKLYKGAVEGWVCLQQGCNQ